ncbi:MAG TPA: polyphenol oxidase family protein [Candidatus Saccharimonadia bacterium]|nr:polyphenol oxidase family protein [Candidatus Saccharimonadia bacterium]
MIRLKPFSGVEVAFTERNDGSIDSADQLRSFFTDHVEQNVNPVVLGLTHATGITEVTQPRTMLDDVDAAFTNKPGIALAFRMADCLPIALFDAKHHAIALIHGSWRTLIQGLLEKTLLELQVCYGVQPTQLQAWIGPSICVDCNKLQNLDVFGKFDAWKPYISNRQDGPHLDLHRYVIDQLMKNGVEKKHIIDEKLCTYHMQDRFFSHRRATEQNQPNDDGRMMMAVWRNHG